MLQRLILLVSTLLLSMAVFPQSNNWNTTIDLSVSADRYDRVDIYTDADGNHVILQKSNQLTYYLFDAEGTQIRTSTRDNNVAENPRLSRIVGWEGDLYIIYKEGDKIKTQKSTDAGATWSTSAVSEITMANSTSNGIDTWTDTNGVHLVYSYYNSSDSDYETKYQRNSFNESDWNDDKVVTDESGVNGGFPSVATSSSRVHVTFTAGDWDDPVGNRDVAKTRDLSSSTWQSSYELFDDTGLSRIIATSGYLHGFYYDFVPFRYDLYHKTRSLTGTTWSVSSSLILVNSDPGEPIGMAVTNDGKLHITYFAGEGEYREWQGSWSSAYTYTSDYTFNQRIAANSNDVYVIWIDDDNETLKLRQRDFAPLAPLNLVRSISSSHPRIDWDANAEADLDEYEVWKKKGSGSWGLLATTGNDYYVDTTESGVSLYPQVNNIEIKYKLKAVDLGSNASDYSAEVTFNQSGGGLDKKGNPNDDALPTVFALAQNYPNPFNPTTSIRYSLPEATHVTLTVYNLSGEKVATLVNGEQAAGSYDTVFDASGLPSGVYLYRLTTPVVSQSRKMMILK